MDQTTIKQRICQVLNCTEEQYARHQYECGLNYLALYLHGLEPVSRELEGNRIFWNWWKIHWAMRDRQFLAAKHQGNHWALYLNMHDPAMLAAEMRPNAVVLGRSYCKMIGQVIKQEVAA
jgi:hypothetical protein